MPFAAALTGTESLVLADAVAISLAASPEAKRLLDGMEQRIRMLTTGVDTIAERCVYSVRGPVMWAETITARANSLGNDDVFVCATPSRSFDTVENRVLVASLEALAGAARALRGPLGEKVPAEEAERIREAATTALEWRHHPRLSKVRGGRLSGRDAARLRGGHRMARMAAVVAVRDRAAEPFEPEDLVGLADAQTRAYHRLTLNLIEALVARQLSSGQLSYVDGCLRSGGLSFRHPATGRYADSGLFYRGVPLAPPEDAVARAVWRSNVAAKTISISSASDIERLLDRLAEREQQRKGGRRVASREGSGPQASGPSASSGSAY